MIDELIRTIPPIVGVPRFTWWLFGPSSLIICPMPRLARIRISEGVKMKLSKSESAPAKTMPFIPSPPPISLQLNRRAD